MVSPIFSECDVVEDRRGPTAILPNPFSSGPLSVELSKNKEILVGPVGIEPTKGCS